MSASISVTIKDAAARAGLEALARRAQSLPLLLPDLGLELAQLRARRFQNQRGPGGQTWKAHAASTLARRPKLGKGGTHPILIASRALMQSVTFAVRGSGVEVGSNRAYARIQQMGGQAGRGHKTTIPARPYLDWDAEDEKATLKVIRRHLALAGLAELVS